ncbi:MAG: hypothetical protein ABIG10_02690 [bacterium]
MKNLKQFFNFEVLKTSTKFLIASIIIMSVSFIYIAVAAPPTSEYTPGETLTPTCSPGDTNCTVTSPLTDNQTITLSGDISGSGTIAITTVIGAEQVEESMLKAVDAASDEECLTYETTTGDFEWQTCSAASGDVGGVGDCTSGACLDGTSDGGTYIKLYDAEGAGQLINGNLTAIRTWTMPDATGTIALTSSNVATATALAANGANCSAGEIALGVDDSGAVEGCYEPSEADISDLVHLATAITDGIIIEADISGDVDPADADFLQYDSTGANFTWRSAAETLSDIGAQGTLTNSAGLLAALDDETGTGVAVFGTSPTFTTGIAVPNDSISAAELNEGDAFVWTSTHDFGGATSIEIVNGSAPTVNAIGEIALDTTSDQLLIYGASARVITYEKEVCFALEDPVDADDNIAFFFPRKAITITDVYCQIDGGTSVAMVISDGTNVLESITCDDDGAEDDGSIANGTFTALERMEFDLDATSGVNTLLNACVTYAITAD